MLCSTVLVVSLLATAYETDVKEKGKEWLVHFNGRKATGDSTASDFIWMDDLSGRSKAKALFGLWNNTEDSGLDGAVGLQDASTGSILSALLFENDLDGATHRYAIHFGNGISQGNFQFHGIDTGTFEEPAWYSLPSNCVSPGSKCYDQISVSELLINQQSVGDANFIISTNPTIVLPKEMFKKYQSAATEEGKVNFEFQFSGGKGKLHSVSIKIDKGSISSGPDPIFGAPIFEQLNVAFELNARGHRSKIGFASVRDNVYSSEEFVGNPISKSINENAYIMTIGLGGPWGPVQTRFDVIIGLQWSGIFIREGIHNEPSLTRPYVGSFMQAVILLGCICPIGILMFVRRVNAAANAENNRNPDAELDDLKIDSKIESPRLN